MFETMNEDQVSKLASALERRIFEKAKAGNARYPVTRLLRQKRAPVHVYWAP